jgi:membrane protein required for colicin V production
MPITLLDIFLLAVMLISGMLAMIRGFMREILSILAWACAAAAAIYAYVKFLPVTKTYINNDILAAGVTIVGGFLLTLIVVSVITVRISDKILDSRIGALDRTLGFMFGLARGLLIVVVAFKFFDWLVKDESKPTWVTKAKSQTVLKATGDWLQSLLPEDIDAYISKTLKKRKENEEQDGAAPDQRTDSSSGPATTGSIGSRLDTQGYGRADRSDMRQLIDGKAGR